jgi:hypothetical protein
VWWGQVTALGHRGTLGSVDMAQAALVGRVSAPPDLAGLYAERLLYLPLGHAPPCPALLPPGLAAAARAPPAELAAAARRAREAAVACGAEVNGAAGSGGGGGRAAAVAAVAGPADGLGPDVVGLCLTAARRAEKRRLAAAPTAADGDSGGSGSGGGVVVVWLPQLVDAAAATLRAHVEAGHGPDAWARVRLAGEGVGAACRAAGADVVLDAAGASGGPGMGVAASLGVATVALPEESWASRAGSEQVPRPTPHSTAPLLPSPSLDLASSPSPCLALALSLSRLFPLCFSDCLSIPISVSGPPHGRPGRPCAAGRAKRRRLRRARRRRPVRRRPPCRPGRPVGYRGAGGVHVPEAAASPLIHALLSPSPSAFAHCPVPRICCAHAHCHTSLRSLMRPSVAETVCLRDCLSITPPPLFLSPPPLLLSIFPSPLAAPLFSSLFFLPPRPGAPPLLDLSSYHLARSLARSLALSLARSLDIPARPCPARPPRQSPTIRDGRTAAPRAGPARAPGRRRRRRRRRWRTRRPASTWRSGRPGAGGSAAPREPWTRAYICPGQAKSLYEVYAPVGDRRCVVGN